MAELVQILLVDDSTEDAILVQRFARRAKIANPIHHVSSGQAALEYLSDPEIRMPGLVLLDINMPGLTGHETLQRIRQHERADVNRLPVVILTTSDSPSDIEAAYDERANSYVVKPPDAQGFQTIVESLNEYWFQIVKRPGDR